MLLPLTLFAQPCIQEILVAQRDAIDPKGLFSDQHTSLLPLEMASSEQPLAGSSPRKRVDLQGRTIKVESANERLACTSSFEVPDLWPKGVGTCSPVEWHPGSWNQEVSFQDQAKQLLSKNASNNAMKTRRCL